MIASLGKKISGGGKEDVVLESVELYCLAEAQHIQQKVQLSVKYGLVMNPDFIDFLGKKAHEHLWESDKQEEQESEDENGEEDYLPRLSPFKVAGRFAENSIVIYYVSGEMK